MLPWALSVLLEIARQERSVLLGGDKRLLREGDDVAWISNQKENYEILNLILIRLECMCILLRPPKRCTWILKCWSVQYYPLRRNTVMMWWWYGGPTTSYSGKDLDLNTSDLTQRSGLVTRIASDLGRVCQKYPCTLWSIIGLRHLPPRMKNQCGLNEKKTLQEKE